MNNRKPVLYILLTVLGIIFAYNYMIAPLLMQYNSRMGMGMHWRMYGYTGYLIDFRIILFIAAVISGLLLFEFLKPQTKTYKCGRCGKIIENDRWRVCPLCGSALNNRKG